MKNIEEYLKENPKITKVALVFCWSKYVEITKGFEVEDTIIDESSYMYLTYRYSALEIDYEYSVFGSIDDLKVHNENYDKWVEYDEGAFEIIGDTLRIIHIFHSPEDPYNKYNDFNIDDFDPTDYLELRLMRISTGNGVGEDIDIPLWKPNYYT